MENTIHLSIVSPNGQLFDKNVKMVTLPGEEGEFGVLPGHADTLSLLKAGVVEIQMEGGKKDYVAINWGYTKVSEGTVDVLIDGAIHIGGDSESELAESIREAKEMIDAVSEDKIAISAALSKVDHVGKSIL